MESDFRDQVRSGDTLERAGGSQGGEVVRFELYFEGRVNSVNVSFILKTLWWLPSALTLAINSKIMNCYSFSDPTSITSPSEDNLLTSLTIRWDSIVFVIVNWIETGLCLNIEYQAGRQSHLTSPANKGLWHTLQLVFYLYPTCVGM